MNGYIYKIAKKKIKIEVRTFTAKFCAYFDIIRSFLEKCVFDYEYAREILRIVLPSTTVGVPARQVLDFVVSGRHGIKW